MRASKESTKQAPTGSYTAAPLVEPNPLTKALPEDQHTGIMGSEETRYITT